MTASDNPFSAHRILPGAIPYLFSHEDESTDLAQLDRLTDSWQANGYLGQIVGAHGCGKTTLAYAIARRSLENQYHAFDSATSLIIQGRRLSGGKPSRSWLDWLFAGVKFRTSHVAVDNTNVFSRTPNRVPTKTILIIDGIERMTLMQQAVTFHSLKRRQIPTLLTVHRVSKTLPLVGCRCPVLFRVGSDIRLFTKIAKSMTRTTDCIDPSVVEASFNSCGGNVRDAFMKLYDAFESNDIS